MPKERVKRVPPDRTEPQRSWSTVLRPSAAPPPQRPAEVAAQSPPPHAEPWARVEEPPLDGASAEPAYEAVNGAYRVIDEYMRQGQRVAQDFWLPLGQAAATPQSRLLERFVRATGDLATAWLEMFQSHADAPPAPAGSIEPFGIGRAPSPARAVDLGVAVAVTTRRQVTVHVDVRPQPDASELVLGPLAPAFGDAPPLKSVSCARGEADRRYVFEVQVPDEQPPGVYSAMLIEPRTELPRGTVSIHVA